MITQKRKECLLIFHDFKCEQCHKEYPFNFLQIHRISRQGTYEDHRNLKVLCNYCHKRIHSNEFKQVQSR